MKKWRRKAKLTFLLDKNYFIIKVKESFTIVVTSQSYAQEWKWDDRHGQHNNSKWNCPFIAFCVLRLLVILKKDGNPTDDWFVIAAVIENIEFKAIVLYPYNVTAFRPVAKIFTGVACEQAPGLEERSKFRLSNSGTGSLFAGYHWWGGVVESLVGRVDELLRWVGRQSADPTSAACLNSSPLHSCGGFTACFRGSADKIPNKTASYAGYRKSSNQKRTEKH